MFCLALLIIILKNEMKLCFNEKYERKWGKAEKRKEKYGKKINFSLLLVHSETDLKILVQPVHSTHIPKNSTKFHKEDRAVCTFLCYIIETIEQCFVLFLCCS